jgi:RHS repeat-associated protein
VDLAEGASRARRGAGIAVLGALAAAGVALLVYASVLPTGQSLPLGSKASPFSLTVFSSSSLPPEVQAQEAATAPYLFDRDTTTQHVAYAVSSVQTTFESSQQVSAIKVFGAAPYLLSVQADAGGSFQPIAGLQNLDLTLLPAAWNTFSAAVPVTTGKLLFTLTPATGGTATGLRELEVWTTAAPVTVKDGAALLAGLLGAPPPPQGRIYTALNSSATPTTAVVTPNDSSKTLAANTFNFTLDRAPTQFVRAYLTYELYGQATFVSPLRIINGSNAAVTSNAGGALITPTTTWSTQVERLNPAWLVQGNNTVEFTVLSSSVSNSGYTVRNVRVIGELDTGANATETITPNEPDALGSNPITALYDGDLTTGWKPYPTDQPIDAVTPSVQFVLRRPTQMDAVSLYLSAPIPGQVQLSVRQAGVWTDFPAEDGASFNTGWNTMYVPGTVAIDQRVCDAVKLTFSGGSGSTAEVREFLFFGSGVGGRTAPAKIFITYPDAGQFYGRLGFVQGFVEPWNNGSGNASVTLGGTLTALLNGTISDTRNKSNVGFAAQADNDAWSMDLTATYPNGETVTTTVFFNQQMSQATPATGTLAAAASATVSPNAKKTVSNDESVLNFPAGSVATSTTVTIQPLADTDVPALDLGMTNVTKGPRRGYRYLPHGTKFLQTVAVVVPYDRALIPPGHTEDDVTTFYFDDQAGRWVALDRVSVDKTNKVVNSNTNHFTDMINAVVTVPDHPQTVSFNPTSMKDIKAADPGAQVNLIEPPRASNQGDARLSYPIEMPPGRQGLQPQLALQYSSSGGNGWMGLGWDVPMQAVTIDTRFGVPRYDAGLETETYMLSGEMLTPVAHRGDLVARTPDKVFHTRVEGQFKRIIRRGSAPSNYTWEVTDKNGVVYLYGATDPLTETLTDAGGNIYLWALCKITDPNGNFVRYHYAKVSDTGVPGGTVPGSNIYLSSVTYTGSAGVEGLYSVNFFRDRDLNEPRRPDVQIDARGGFKRVTADLLRKIEVTFAGALVRRYEFGYNENPFGDNRPALAFNKTLLTSINQFAGDGTPFNSHTLTYYDEARNANGSYNGFAGATGWSIGNDGVGAGLMGKGAASALGGTTSTNAGGHIYIGVGVGDDTTSKEETGGIKIGFSRSTSETLIAMADMNGDGLPDKVFKGGGGFSYRPNQSGPNGATSFGPSIQLPTLPAISKERVTSTTFGAEFYFGLAVQLDLNRATTQADTYFTDVNGDGITDLVSGGSVLFGFINANGVPTFSANSADTPVPVGTGAIETTNLLEDASALEAERAANFPLLDTLRRWVAPYDGVVNITAPVNLVQDTSEARAQYQNADGVRVAIQLEGSELWATTIGPTDYSVKTPTGVGAVPVHRGDRIYFRVQSIFDGAFDQVAWNPNITYAGADATRTDVNNLPEYVYQASSDFTLGGRGPSTVKVPLTGVLHLAGTFAKTAPTTDDVALVVTRNGIEVSRRTIAAADTASLDLSQDVAVSQFDLLQWQIFVDSPIDATRVQLVPSAYYTSAQGVDTVTDEQGNFVLKVVPTFDMDLYPISSATAPQDFFTASATGSVSVQARVQATGLAAGAVASAVFTVKRRGALLAKVPVTITGTGDPTVETTVAATVNVTLGDQVFFDLSSRDPFFTAKLSLFEVTVDGSVVPSAVHTREAPGALFPQPYRGWGAAGYNGNSPRDALPIDQTLLVVNQFTTTDNLRAYFYFPQPADNSWGGADDQAWVKPAFASSSRLGLDDIRMPTGAQFAGQSAPARISRSTNTSASVAVTASTGKSESQLDFQDLNGDRFPDVVSASGGVQFSRAAGGLEAGRRGSGPGTPRSNDNQTVGGSTSLGGNVAVAIGNNKGQVVGSGQRSGESAKQGMDMATLGFSADVGLGQSSTDHDLIDINGDGLPDKVFKDGSVALNLGYGFAAAEPWGGGVVNEGTSVDAGGGLNIGFNQDDYSLAGGISLTIGQSTSDEVYADINGDGLPDKLTAGSVRLNTGTGYTGPISWPGLQGPVSVDKHVSLNGGFFFTFGFTYLGIVKVVFNPGINLSTSIGRPEVTFRDMDGDGFTDQVRSTQDSELNVALNPIGRTNLLRRVVRPMGATIDLEYVRDGNTYDLPQSRWLMTKTTVFDGHVGEGADTQVTTYRYSGPKYNRLERDFYGYGTVVEEHRDTQNLNALYRSITRTYRTDGYYTKGLMSSEVTADAFGRPFTETDNTYVLRDVDLGIEPVDGTSLTDTIFPQLTRTDRLFYEGQLSPGKTTFTTHTYDNFGNIATFADAGDLPATDDVFATIAYTNCQPAYIIKPSHIDVRGNGTLMRLRDANIDCTTGNLTQVRQSLADGTTAVTDLAYFANGNLQVVTGPANRNAQRYALTYTYDPTVATHVASITDSFGLSSQATYDLRYGKVATTTDTNGNQTTNFYDTVGRITQIFGPYEQGQGVATLAFEYHPEAAVPWAITRHVDKDADGAYKSTGTIDTILLIDGLKRVIQTKKDATVLEGNANAAQDKMIVSGQVSYDALGRTVTQRYPTSEQKASDVVNGQLSGVADAVAPTTMQYDVLDRNTRTTIPDGSFTTITYGFGADRAGVTQFETVVTDANVNAGRRGAVKRTYRDVRQMITGVKEFNNAGSQVIWTSYNYDALKQITQVVDNLQNTTSISYDNFGRRTVVNNPDTGRMETQYDLASNVVKKITANLQAQSKFIDYNYDFNRLSAITYPNFPGNNVTYAYGAPGAAGNTAGRITTITSQMGTEQRQYGKLGETVYEKKTVTTFADPLHPSVFETRFLFESFGRMLRITYPDGEIVTNTYDSGGNLNHAEGVKRVDSQGQNHRYVYLDSLLYDKFEQRALMRQGNGVTTVYTFDAQTRRLSNLNAVRQGSNIFQNLNYSYDKVGNILGLANNVAVPPPNVYGGPTNQSFAYDDLYRLTHAQGTYQFSPSKSHSYTMDMVYDTIHNITRKTQADAIIEPSGVSTPQKKVSYDFGYVYNPSGPTSVQPHAPIHIGVRTYTYDLNGNQTGWTHDTNGTRRTITWDDENRIQAVFDNGHEKDYKYDDGGNRVIKRGPQGETLYVNQFYTQRPGATGTKQIYAGTTRIASKLVKQDTPGANPNGNTPFEKDIFFYHPDHLGSTNYVTDLNGKLYEHLEYFPFGESWVEENSNTQRTPYLFSAKELDEETGLYYFGARYYDPRTSVWQNPDPILGDYLLGKPSGGVYLPANLALYTYARNTPIKLSDPDGRWPTDKHGEMTYQKLIARGYTHEVANRMAIANMLEDSGTASALKTGGSGTSYKASFNLFKAMLSSDFWANQKNDELHATGGKVAEAADLAQSMKNDAIEKLLSGDVQGAQELLGGGSHPVQDEAAHNGISFAKHMALTVLHKVIRFVTLGLVNPHLDPDDITKQGGVPFKQSGDATAKYFEQFETDFSAAAKQRGYSNAQIEEKLRAFKGQTSGSEE